MPEWIISSLCAASVLTSTELLLLVFGTGGGSLTPLEWVRYLVCAGSSLTIVCLAFASVGVLVGAFAKTVNRWSQRLGSDARAAGVVLGLGSTPLILLGFWLMTSGRRAREVPLRALWVALATLVTAFAVMRLSTPLYRLITGERERGRRIAASGLAVVSIVALVTDAFVLARLYPAFHWALSVISIASIVCASVLILKAQPIPVRTRLWMKASGLSMTAVAPIALVALYQTPNAWFAVTQHAPLTGKIADIVRGLKRPKSTARSERRQTTATRVVKTVSSERGIDLRGKSVLLITIDALRADRVSAYGGRGLTPNIDTLAQQSAVFLHAYTPAPDTYFALGSLMTGEFLRSTVLLSSGNSRRTTLPELLQRSGYHTAAFYPPAVSNVERRQLTALTERHFGFDYYRGEFVSAHDRVKQLDEYLRQLQSDDRVFVWVHLFEPHEPYQPPPRFIRGKTQADLYDGEVADTDEAVGELIKRFRRERTDATVILTADHGEEFGDHGGYYHGTTVYDDQIRVPLIWSSPREINAIKLDVAVEIVDVTTTLLSALGIARDPRMQGNDVGAVLKGAAPVNTLYAFSEIGEFRMVTDARYKAIFKSGESIYQLYDLKTDPGEKYNLSADHIEVLERLRAALAQHLAFTARLDAIAAKTERDWPEALTRALLGDPSAGPDLVPLLGSQRAEVKIAAARGCAEIGYRAALPVLSTLWEHKTDPARYEAAIAALLLGDKNAAALVLEALNQVRKRADVESLYVARRAALALSRASITAGILVLITWAQDTNADLRDRKRAIDALSAIGSRKALKPLCGLLSDPYLRIDVANALGKIGDRSAVSPLAKQLASEPYPPAREALTNAIEKLKSENRRHKPLYSHLENSR